MFLRFLSQLRRQISHAPGTNPRIDFGAWNVDRLSAAWRSAWPFSHVVIDELVPVSTLTALSRAIDAEPHQPNRGELYDMMGSAHTVTHPTLRAFHARLGSDEALAAVAAVTGKPVSKVVMRSFIYVNGSYLLPHTDHRHDLERRVAFAYYVHAAGNGGELEFFDCTLAKSGEILETRPGVRLPSVSNRLVLFDVAPGSLHRVHEVLGGRRLSLSGWFYA